MILFTRRRVLLILLIRSWSQWISLEFEGLKLQFLTMHLDVRIGQSDFIFITSMQSSSPESECTVIEGQESIIFWSSDSITCPEFCIRSSSCYASLDSFLSPSASLLQKKSFALEGSFFVSIEPSVSFLDMDGLVFLVVVLSSLY